MYAYKKYIIILGLLTAGLDGTFNAALDKTSMISHIDFRGTLTLVISLLLEPVCVCLY